MLTGVGVVPGPDVADLTRRLLEISALTSTRIAGLLSRLGLTPTLAAALWALDPEQPPVPMSGLAQVLGCDRSNVTLITDKLESAGLAKRSGHPTDGRARVLGLTSAGVRLRSQIDAQMSATTGLDRLSQVQLRQLSAILTKLNRSSA